LLAFVLASSATCLEARASEAGQPQTIDSVAACSNLEPPPRPGSGPSEEVGKLAKTAIDYPPMQAGGSFNLDAVKKKIADHHATGD
jgi:hypothetical protein